MAKFLWKGVSPQGRERIESVEATSPKEARAILEGQGWKNLSLLTEEIHHYTAQQVESASDPGALFRSDDFPEEPEPEEAPEIQAQRLQGKNGFFWEWW